MIRLRLLLTSLCLVGITPLLASAQEAWPQYFVEPTPDPHDFLRGPGFYLAMYKLILVALVLIIWVKLAAWVNADTQILGDRSKMEPEVWNPIMVFPFFAGFLFVISFPLFLLGFPLFVLSAFVPFFVYFFQRNSRVSKDDRARLKMERSGNTDFQMAPVMHQEGPPVEFRPAASDPRAKQGCLIAIRQNPAFPSLKGLYADAITRRVDQILLDFTREQVAVRYQVDGIWHNMPAMDRELGDAMLFAMKQLADLDPQDRRGKQTGEYGVSIPGRKSRTILTSQGVQTGERVLLKLISERKKIMTLKDCGMIASMEERLRKHLNSPGMVLVSCMPGDGMTTNWNAVLESSDRILRDFHALGPKVREHEFDTFTENVDFATYDPETGNPETTLKTLLLKQPEALVLPEPISNAILDKLAVEVVKENRFVITRVPARSSAEAIVRILAMKVDRSKFAKALTAVVYSRLVRRLCDNCKQPYEPSPQLLAKLGLKPGQIDTLYREWQPPPPEELVDEKGRPIEPEICPVCGGLGYLGRIAIFEVMEIDDGVRAVMVNQPQAEAINKAARKAGQKSLQEEGIKLVLAGVTSINELQRVLKASQT